ncbi:MAG TPA: MBL fold metallo-hydrolase [Candidatus Paceibacterota bacterium]|nr:MBL fold metallo-hydrolase [Candidatus Paceibacterota bacterium]
MLLFSLELTFLIIFAILQLPQFGKAPGGRRKSRMLQSENYKRGKFHNLEPTPMMIKTGDQIDIFKKFFFKNVGDAKPKTRMPGVKIDLHAFDPKANVMVWFGHSSYFIQQDGKRFLIDPVLSGYASPFSFAVKNFAGSNEYSAADIPDIDYLVITHDHYDHLDYHTAKALKGKVAMIITGLGVGAHLVHWGYKESQIKELDWHEELKLDEGFTIRALPSRHFSGRTFFRNRTLWCAFALSTPNKKFFLGGDGGYGKHFKMIGEKYGPFDVAILENGQYNESWRYIHAMPEETAQAGLDLGAKLLMPVHWGKFILSIHSWDEPIRRITKAATAKNIPLLTPRIGEKINLDHPAHTHPWWDEVK